MTVLSANFSPRIFLSFFLSKLFFLQTKRQKENQNYNQNSIVASLATTDWEIVPKMEHPVSQKLKTAKSKYFC